jgi:hypothetical protein
MVTQFLIDNSGTVTAIVAVVALIQPWVIKLIQYLFM